jgi:polysaccharide chain length determinant protein (PEP-CTERM system associated)
MPSRNFQLSVRDYLQVILHRKWLFIVPLIASFAISVMIAKFLPRVYRSYGVILVEEKRISNPLIEHIAVARSINDKMNVVRSQIFSHSYLEGLIKDMRLDVDYDDRAAMALAIGELRREIQVSVPGGQTIRVVCEREDPEEAKGIVEYLIDRLIEENFKLQEWEVKSALKFIDAQMEIYDKRLEASDIFIHGFDPILGMSLTQSPEQNLGILQTMPGVVDVDVRKLVEFEKDLIEIDIEKKIMGDKLDELRSRMDTDKDEFIFYSTKETDPVLNELLTDLYSKQAQLDALLIDSTDRHPGVMKLREEIELINVQIESQRKKRVEMKDYVLNPAYREIQEEVRETEMGLRQLEMKEEEFDKWVQKYRERLKGLPEQQLRKLRLLRDYTVDLNIYTLLKQKRETALLTQRLDVDEKGTRFRLLDPPQVPLSPIRPNVSMIILLGTILGACIGGGLIFASEFADHSFRDITEARRYLDLPVLGSISHIGTSKRWWKPRTLRRSAAIILGLLFVFLVLLMMRF